MAWSYSGNPSSSAKDAVRFEIPDTESTAPLLQDEEINYALEQEGQDVLAAAAHCCEGLARKLSLQADSQIGSVKTTYTNAAKNLAQRAEELRKRVGGLRAPFAGGLSESEKQSREENTDRVASPFKLRQFQGAPSAPDNLGRFG